MKKTINLTEKSLLTQGILGVVWISVGFMNILKSNLVLTCVYILLLLVGIVAITISFLIKTEPEDELSIKNSYKTTSLIYQSLNIVIGICVLISMFKSEWIVNLKIILPFLLGIIKFLECTFFIAYEKVGE